MHLAKSGKFSLGQRVTIVGCAIKCSTGIIERLEAAGKAFPGVHCVLLDRACFSPFEKIIFRTVWIHEDELMPR
jgi:hypothetical protein